MLLVEDDVVLGKLVATLLDDAGYRSVTIADHDEITGAIDRFHPSCVILDGELERRGQSRSWRDAAAIRRAHPRLPVLMFTADADAVAEERAGTSRRSRDAGFVGVVSKPFVVDDLLTTLQSAIEGQPARLEFFSTAVQELKTPLATISGKMQLARKVIGSDPARGQAEIDIALEQVEHVGRLIGRLQKDLRLTADVIGAETVTLDLCEAVADAIDRHERGETPGFRLSRPEEHVRVRGVGERIARILDNLLSNAVKYSPAGAPVDISITTIEGEAQVRVEDYGVGVSWEERDRMFAAHYRRRRAEKQSVRVWLEDNTDAGSVFALAVPLAD